MSLCTARKEQTGCLHAGSQDSVCRQKGSRTQIPWISGADIRPFDSLLRFSADLAPGFDTLHEIQLHAAQRGSFLTARVKGIPHCTLPNGRIPVEWFPRGFCSSQHTLKQDTPSKRAKPVRAAPGFRSPAPTGFMRLSPSPSLKNGVGAGGEPKCIF